MKKLIINWRKRSHPKFDISTKSEGITEQTSGPLGTGCTLSAVEDKLEKYGFRCNPSLLDTISRTSSVAAPRSQTSDAPIGDFLKNWYIPCVFTVWSITCICNQHYTHTNMLHTCKIGCPTDRTYSLYLRTLHRARKRVLQLQFALIYERILRAVSNEREWKTQPRQVRKNKIALAAWGCVQIINRDDGNSCFHFVAKKNNNQTHNRFLLKRCN